MQLRDDKNGASTRVELRKKVIHRRAWSKANEGEVFLDEIEPGELESIIRKVAGVDKRTVDKYIDILKDEGRIRDSPTGSYKVEQPDGSTMEAALGGNKTSIHIELPRELKNKAEKYGLNISGILTIAILDEIGYKRMAAERLMPEYSFEEQDYVFRLISQGLHKRGHSDEEESNRTHQRAKLYEEMVDEDEPYKNAEALRQRAWRLAEQLGFEKQEA